MKIPNYDRKTKDSKKINNIFDEDFRLLIAGESGCGKTNTLMHMLRKPLVYFDKLHFYSPNSHQDKLQDLKKIMDNISQQVGYPVLEFHGPNDVKNTTDYPSENRKIVIFDDLVNAPEKIQKKIANHFTDGRHHGISPVYLTQSYYDTPQKIRLNSSHMILYPPQTINHRNLISRENQIDPKNFDYLKPFEFLFIDKNKKKQLKKFLMKLFKMGVLNNIQRFKTFDIREYIKNFQRQIQTGLKLDKNNNYDIQQKRLANTGEGVDGSVMLLQNIRWKPGWQQNQIKPAFFCWMAKII